MKAVLWSMLKKENHPDIVPQKYSGDQERFKESVQANVMLTNKSVRRCGE